MTDNFTVLEARQLDYGALVSHLTLHPSFPCSQHIRNHLLAPYAAHVTHPALHEATVDDDPWRTYFDYRKGASLAAVGDVPQSVWADGVDKTRSNGTHAADDDDNDGGLWALVIVYANYAPGWVEDEAIEGGSEAGTTSVWNGIRFALWLSSERPLRGTAAAASASSDERFAALQHATEAELAILRFVCHTLVPSRVADVSRTSATKHTLDKDGATLVDIAGVHNSWVEAIQTLSSSSADDSARPPMRVARTNPCLTLVMPEEKAQAMAVEAARSTRWTVDRIAADARDAELVLGSNNISYPGWYLRHRRHVSVLLTDGPRSSIKDDDVDNDVYPTAVRAGAPAGWVYAHDDFSVASLHVATPYRRRRAGSNDGSVGKICLALLAVDLVKCQKHALAMALGGKEAAAHLATPVLSDAEMQKSAAIAFHTSHGFVPVSVSTWGAVAVWPPT